jgi:hypothetical protein
MLINESKIRTSYGYIHRYSRDWTRKTIATNLGIDETG